jgi:hypothetical protein
MEFQKIQQVTTSENLKELQDEIDQKISGVNNMGSDSQTLQSTTTDSGNLRKLPDEIIQEIDNLLNNSKLGKLLEKYNVSKEAVIKFQCSIDLSKIQIKNDEESKISNLLIEETQKQASLVTECPWVWCPHCGFDGRWIQLC